jgi:hypothetical protein
MRMGIVLGHGTMGCPAGVGNTNVCNKTLASSVEFGNTTNGANALNGICTGSLVCATHHRKAGRVVASVL